MKMDFKEIKYEGVDRINFRTLWIISGPGERLSSGKITYSWSQLILI